MGRAHQSTLLTLAWLAIAPAAIAQQAASAEPLMYRRWDTSASYGVLFANGRDPNLFTSSNVAVNVDVGRYLSTHLKIDGGVMWNPEYSRPPERYPIGGLPKGSEYLEYAWTTVHPTSVAGSATYQFGENLFAHPYVSAGARVTLMSEHTVRQPWTATINRASIAIPGIDEQHTSIAVRPFVAVGCKSYFNTRVFMRSELLAAAGPAGYSHATLRIGAGVDF
jgi:hypothetical protein